MAKSKTSSKPSANRKGPRRPSPRSKPRAPAGPEPNVPKLKLSARDRKHYEELLVQLRDRLLDGINFLATNNLRHSQKEASGDISSYSTHMADAGTDAFDREFALSLVSNEQDALYEVTEALKRLENQTYGLCEMCGKPIPRARLDVLPFARFCIKCQEAREKDNRRPRKFTPQNFPQFQETEEAEAEAEEEKEQA
jgi:RNA polymerase-binding transcription factor DksA